MSTKTPISIPHFTLENFQVKPIWIQLSKARSSQPKVSFSGLIDQHIRESIVRLSAAFQWLDFKFPQNHVTIHFTPAVYDKRGSDYDLLLAVGILSLFKRIPALPENTLFLSELGLGGELIGSERFLSYYHHVTSHLPDWTVITSRGPHDWIAQHNGPTRQLRAFHSLEELVSAMGASPQLPLSITQRPLPALPATPSEESFPLECVQGLTLSKVALCAALIARVPLLFVGLPGVGKTMLSHLAKDLLPQLTFENWLRINHLSYSCDTDSVDRSAPFRAPHYHSSMESFVGSVKGGKFTPGEFSHANGGVLFLDELPYFKPHVLEALRTPLESKDFLLSRAQLHVRLPAEFVLLAAMNPCPCGYYYFEPMKCRCAHAHISKYLSRVSGPLLERFGIIHLINVEKESVEKEKDGENPYTVDVCASDIKTLRENFDQRFDPKALTDSLDQWLSSHKDTIPAALNKRRERHMKRVAFALSLLRADTAPGREDWDLAWEFQNNTTFFAMLGM